MANLAQVQRLVAAELATFSNPARRDAFSPFLLPEPRAETRAWDYGAPGERLPYWVVAEAPTDGLLFVYCDQGFGPAFPWGGLYTDDPGCVTLGMDAQWHWYLEEAFARSRLWPRGLEPDDPLHLPPDERFELST